MNHFMLCQLYLCVYSCMFFRLDLLLLHSNMLCSIHRLHQCHRHTIIPMDLRFVVSCSTCGSAYNIRLFFFFVLQKLNCILMQYGPQMIMGQPRPVLYMPAYPSVRFILSVLPLVLCLNVCCIKYKNITFCITIAKAA